MLKIKDNSLLDKAPPTIAVVMITLNEGHNLRGALENISGWADEIFILDSYSRDCTVNIALEFGANVAQRKFTDFGDQWNFALTNFPIRSSWVMKLDPDERLSDKLKSNLRSMLTATDAHGIFLERRLWFMGKPLLASQQILRVWRAGKCRFTDVTVNEYPVVGGPISTVSGYLEHFDSPNLEHWIEKQNRYSTLEATNLYKKTPLALSPRLFGSATERWMWLKKNFQYFPLRYLVYFLYCYLYLGGIFRGYEGYVWSRLRVSVLQLVYLKYKEMKINNSVYNNTVSGIGAPDLRVKQFD